MGKTLEDKLTGFIYEYVRKDNDEVVYRGSSEHKEDHSATLSIQNSIHPKWYACAIQTFESLRDKFARHGKHLANVQPTHKSSEVFSGPAPLCEVVCVRL